MNNGNLDKFTEIKEELVKGNFQKALDKLDNIDDDYEAEKKYYYGIIYANKKEYNEAEKYLLDTIKTNKEHIGAYLSLSEVYNMQEKYDKAKYLLNKAYEINSNNINIITYLVGIDMHLKDYDEAIQLLRKLLKHNEDTKIKNILIKAIEDKTQEEIKNKNFSNIISNAKEMIELNEDYYGGYKLLGLYYYDLKDYKQAKDYLIKSYQLNNNDIHTLNILTSTLIRLGDLENAKISNEQTLLIDPDNLKANEFKQIINETI